MFLSTQVVDEARHIEAFTKRALANGGGLRYSTAQTQASLRSLLEQEDFSQASFLLSVLGEGAFLEYLSFIERYAPDPVTADIVRRARVDEARHVAFGVEHARHFLASRSRARRGAPRGGRTARVVPCRRVRREPARRGGARRAGGGRHRGGPARRRRKAVRELHQTMHRRRVGRLRQLGFDETRPSRSRSCTPRTSCEPARSHGCVEYERHDRVLDAHGLVLAHALGQDRELDPVPRPCGTRPSRTARRRPSTCRSSPGHERGPAGPPACPARPSAARTGGRAPTARRPRATAGAPCPGWSRGPRRTARRRRGARTGGRRSPAVNASIAAAPAPIEPVPETSAPRTLPSTSASKLTESTFMRRRMSTTGADEIVAIFTRGPSAAPIPAAPLTTTSRRRSALDRNRAARSSGSPICVPPGPTLPLNVSAVGMATSIDGEVVLPPLGPPVALEGAGVADHRSLDPCHARLRDLLRERLQRVGGELGVAVPDEPEIPVDHAVDGRGRRHRARGDHAVGPDRLQECHREEQLLVRRRRARHPAEVSVPQRAVIADRDGHPSFADQPVDPCLPRRVGRLARSGSASDRRRVRSGGRRRGRDRDGGDHAGDQEGGEDMTDAHVRTMVRGWSERRSRCATCPARAPAPQRASRCAPRASSAAPSGRAAGRRSSPGPGRS